MAESITDFLGNAVGEGAAFAAGLAVGPVLSPVLQALRNETWSVYPDNPLLAELLAQGVAEGKITLGDGQSESALTGISNSRFETLVTLAEQAPGIAAGMELIRRGQLPAGNLPTLLKRAGLETNYLSAYEAQGVNGVQPWEITLTPQEIALGMVRGTVDSSGLLAVTLDTSDSNIAKYPVWGGDGLAEAAAGGVDMEKLRVLVGSIGLPMAVGAAAQAAFRGIITKGGFYQAVLEGDTRPEWADAIFEHQRQILTAHDYVELHLRGWITAQQMYAGTALHGMSQADTDLFFEVLGRPIPVHQVTTGLARGGEYNGDTSQIPDAYLRSLEEGNQRPEWYSLSYANRYTLPGYFVVKAMLAAGSVTVDDAAVIFTQEGWPPDLAQKAAAALAPTTGTGSSAHVKSAQTQAITTIKRAYTGGAYAQPEAVAALTALDVTGTDQTTILKYWDEIAKADAAIGAAEKGATA